MRDILPELNGKEYTDGLYEDYDIRFCRVDEHADIRTFLKDYWREDHIFVLSKEMLDFQHLDKKNNRYNFVIAREKISGDIHAILGFVPTSQYDNNIQDTMIWPCIWKSRKDIDRKGLGVILYYHLKTNIEIETISILGISEIALSIYRHWDFQTGEIEQYVYPNFKAKSNISKGLIEEASGEFENVDSFGLSKITEQEYSNISSDNRIFFVNSKYKSKDYYLNRFFRHPIYQYDFLEITDDKEIRGILIVRACGDGKNECLRIVDCIGEVDCLIGVKFQLQLYLQDNMYEYVDFIEVGLDDALLKAAGFYRRKDYPNVIVPNYFEPFLQENVDLDYAYKTIVEDSKLIFFKADADQDRPNVL
jgi:hypothetical protein